MWDRKEDGEREREREREKKKKSKKWRGMIGEIVTIYKSRDQR